MSDKRFSRHTLFRIRGFHMSLILNFVLFFNFVTHAQVKFDNNWQFSNYIKMNFDGNHPIVYQSYPDSPFIYGIFNVSMSDSTGNYLFYSGGTEILNRESKIMNDGSSINPSFYEVGIGPGTSLPQGLIAIPYPGQQSTYLVFTLDYHVVFPSGSPYYFLVPQNLLFHVVDMALNNGLGKVISKRQVAIHDTLSRGYIQACKHANGRDWWVILPIWNSNCYYSILINQDGIQLPAKQCIGIQFGDSDGGGSAAFSPNGNKYSRVNSDYGIVLMDFDRCSGTLSNALEISYPPDEPYFAGSGFSPNSRFLYITTRYHVWQYDLNAEDVEASRMLVGEVPEEFHGQVGTGSLYLQQIGPDHKIYIASPGNHYYLSTIEQPNRKGIDCEFVPYSMFLSSGGGNYAGIPNHPNYRLGPIDGSGCDTLGIDNIPVAYFRYDTSETDPLDFEFTDLSYFEPANWTWDFGDGDQSDDQNPSHTYSKPGMYEVCLMVSNANGSDNFCRTLDLMTTGTREISPTDIDLLIFPNPTSKSFFIVSREDHKIREVRCYDLSGNRVAQLLNVGSRQVRMEIPRGNKMLVVKVLLENGSVLTNKIVVQE